MKYPLLTVILTVLFLSTSQARQSTASSNNDMLADKPARRLKISKFQIGLSLGGMYNTTFEPHNQPYFRWLTPNKSSATIALNAIYSGKHWRYGLSVGHNNLNYSVRDSRGIESHWWESSLPIIHSKLSVDRALTHGKREFYCGVAAGALIWTRYATSSQNYLSEEHWTIVNYSMGLQAGLTYHINEIVHFNVQLSADYVGTKPQMFLYSASVGLRFSIHHRIRG